MTRYEFWRQIIAVSDELDEKAARHAELDADGKLRTDTQPARTGPPQRETKWRALDERRAAAQAPESETDAQDDRARIEPLQALARSRSAALWKQLAEHPELGEGDAFGRVRTALAIHFDERVLERLPDYLRSSWTRLQTEFTGSSVGGEDFYRFVDQALVDRSLPSLVFEVYHFCLSHGFEGRHANNPGQIEEYERNLEGHITFELPKLPRARVKSSKTLGEPWPARRYYILTLLGAVFYALLLTWWSNYEAPQQHRPAASSTASDTESGDPSGRAPSTPGEGLQREGEEGESSDSASELPREVPVGMIRRPR